MRKSRVLLAGVAVAAAGVATSAFTTSNEGCTADGPYILNCSVFAQCNGLMSVTCSNSQ